MDVSTQLYHAERWLLATEMGRRLSAGDTKEQLLEEYTEGYQMWASWLDQSHDQILETLKFVVTNSSQQLQKDDIHIEYIPGK